MKLDTKVIHAGVLGDKNTGAVNTPIYQVSTYKQARIGEHAGFEYSRSGNPTRQVLEGIIAELEHGHRGFAFASGMSAISTIIALFNSGDHLIVSDDIYGGTYRVFVEVFERLGIEITYVDTSNIDNIEKKITKNTKGLFIETPTNPLLKISDIKSASELCKKNNMLLVVDNTFLTPYWQNPLVLGADIVVHSATKYLGGHSDVLAGLVAIKDADLSDRFYVLQKSIGAVLNPFDSWLLMRGLKTLALRMERHEQSAYNIAEFLQNHKKVVKCYYPGFKNHPNYDTMVNQSRGFGGMISFELETEQAVDKLFSNLKYFTLAESLGAVESLISLPARMTHAYIPQERRDNMGVTNKLVRISVGIENVEDLLNDLEFGLTK